MAQWPHDDGESIAKTVTYTNSGDQPATVDLSVTATGPDGTPAPQGMFTVEPATLTVPAGGRTAATLTIDPALGDQDGIHTSVLVATGGGTAGRTRSR